MRPQVFPSVNMTILKVAQFSPFNFSSSSSLMGRTWWVIVVMIGGRRGLVCTVCAKDLHDCRLFDEYPRINRHPYPAGEHLRMSQHLPDTDVTRLAGMALDVTGTRDRYLCSNRNTLSSHHLALPWIFLVSSNGSLSHFTSVLGPRSQLLTPSCPQTIFLTHELRSISCHDDFSFGFHPFFSRSEAFERPNIWL